MEVQKLKPSDWRLFRDFRLKALFTSPGAFTGTYRESAARTEDDWRGMLTKPTQQIFGLFDDDRLVGITAVFTSVEDADTAELAMAFVEPAYRGRGLSRLLFEACLAWTRARPFRRAVVAHRASNVVAKRMICHFGFQPISRSFRTWPDGTTDDEIGYELVLRK